jgi:hypothetical protein
MLGSEFTLFGYIQIDIDKVSEYNELFENLSYDIYTLACFKSPGGEGIKVIDQPFRKLEKFTLSDPFCSL